MGREDREYRRRHPIPAAPPPAPAPPAGHVPVPPQRLKDWLVALRAAQNDREELGRLRKELGRMQERVRHLSRRLEEFEAIVPNAAPAPTPPAGPDPSSPPSRRRASR